MSEGALRIALLEGERHGSLEARLRDFTEETGRPVEIAARLPLPELIPHLRETAAEGAYDLVCAHSDHTAGLAPLLAPLDDLLPEAESDLSPLSLGLCRRDGRLYQAPRSVETRLLFYRSDIFDDRREQQWFAEASGGRPLRVPQSWEELAAVAQYFTREGRMDGFAFAGRAPWIVHLFAEIVTTVGGTFFDPEGRPRFFSRAGEWSLALLRDLYTRWEAVPRETPEFSDDDVSETFRMGRCALACDYPGTAQLLCDPTFSAVAGWHSVALYPAGPDGRRAVWTGCPTLAIPAAAADPEGAAELLRFLIGHGSQLREARHGALPSRTSAYEEARDNLRPGTLGHLRFTLAEQTLRLAAISAPPLPRYAEIEERLAALLREAIAGEREVADALEQGARAAEALIAEPGT